MKRVARRLRALGLSFDILLSSPLERAKATAKIIAKEFKVSRRLNFTAHLAPEGSIRQLIGLLSRLPTGSENVLLVGHEPHLSHLAGVLIGGRIARGFKLKKAGLCQLTVDRLRYGSCAELEWLLTPEVLVAAGK